MASDTFLRDWVLKGVLKHGWPTTAAGRADCALPTSRCTDDGLYRAKNDGRNRVRCASAATP